LFGSEGTLWWTIKSTYTAFLTYSIYSACIITFQYKTGQTVHDLIDLPEKVPSLMATIQFLAAFLTGMAMTEAAARYKSALAAMLEFQNSMDCLATALTSSTSDPKIRIASQCFISWMMVLAQKSIVFFTEDFSDPVAALIDKEIAHCALFEPQVLWAFELPQLHYLFSSFIIGARLWDSREKTVAQVWNETNGSWKQLYELLTVRTPTTRYTVGKAAVNFFLCLVPIVNEDLASAVMLPIVASMFYAVLNLAKELSDPWGNSLHDLPLPDVLRYLALPAFKEQDQGYVEEAVQWLNKGLKTGDWTHKNGSNPIPRTKATEPNKGETIDFNRMRTLHEVSGFKS